MIEFDINVSNNQDFTSDDIYRRMRESVKYYNIRNYMSEKLYFDHLMQTNKVLKICECCGKSFVDEFVTFNSTNKMRDNICPECDKRMMRKFNPIAELVNTKNKIENLGIEKEIKEPKIENLIPQNNNGFNMIDFITFSNATRSSIPILELSLASTTVTTIRNISDLLEFQ